MPAGDAHQLPEPVRGPLPRERFQPVARQDGQVVEGVRSVQQGEPAHGLIGELPERPDTLALEE